MKDPNTTAIETPEHLGLGRKSKARRGSPGSKNPTKKKKKTKVKKKKKKKKKNLDLFTGNLYFSREDFLTVTSQQPWL